MAERKAQNKYYPPDWEPKKGSINKYRGSHPLRDRARKLHEGILIIRFEMPYNIWCDGCNNHIGMGVRYNAQKSKTGMYYSTPIYKFRMKCHLCDSHFEMQTDPQNLDYVILNGARRQERRWDPLQNDQVVPEDKAVSKKLATDSMFKLEHQAEDKAKAKSFTPAIEQLAVLQERWKDDYFCNQTLRNGFRSKRNELKLTSDKDKQLLIKSSLPLSMKLLPESKDDPKLAKLMKLEATESLDSKRKSIRDQIMKSSIFSETNNEHLKTCDNQFRFGLNKTENNNSKSKIELIGVELKPKSVEKSLESLVDYNNSDSD